MGDKEKRGDFRIEGGFAAGIAIGIAVGFVGGKSCEQQQQAVRDEARGGIIEVMKPEVPPTPPTDNPDPSHLEDLDEGISVQPVESHSSGVDPNNPKALSDSADRLFEEGNFAEAAEMYKTLSDEYKAIEETGWALVAQEAESENPQNNKQAFYAYLKAGNRAKAEEYARLIIQEAESGEGSKVDASNVYKELGDHQNARKLLEIALQKAEEDEDPWFASILLEEMGEKNSERWKKLTKQAAQKNEASHDYSGAAYLYKAAGDDKKAREMNELVIQKLGGKEDHIEEVARAYMELGQDENAQRLLDPVIQILEAEREYNPAAYLYGILGDYQNRDIMLILEAKTLAGEERYSEAANVYRELGDVGMETEILEHAIQVATEVEGWERRIIWQAGRLYEIYSQKEMDARRLAGEVQSEAQ